MIGSKVGVLQTDVESDDNDDCMEKLIPEESVFENYGKIDDLTELIAV